jgi:hypothetical protein
LGGPRDKRSIVPAAPTHRYSELARSWGIQKKEEEETQKKQAHQRIAESQRLKEEEEKERRYFNVSNINMTKLVSQSSRNKDDPLYDLGGKGDEHLNLEEDDFDHTGEEEEEEEEESDHDLDSDWNRRRHKNDL